MTTYIVSANDLNGILDAAVGSDFDFVNENILVSNPVGNGIQLDDAFNSVTIHGHVVSADAIGIHLSAGSGTTGQNALTIGASGSAQGSTVAIRMDDGSNTLINNGGIHGVGLFANGVTIGGANNLVVKCGNTLIIADFPLSYLTLNGEINQRATSAFCSQSYMHRHS